MRPLTKFTLPNQEFIDVFSNHKKFIKVEGALNVTHVGDVLELTGANNGPTMLRFVTHVEVEESAIFYSVRALSKFEKSELLK